MEYVGAVILLLSIFLLGLALGNRITIILFNSWLKDLDREEQLRRLKIFTGYKNERH